MINDVNITFPATWTHWVHLWGYSAPSWSHYEQHTVQNTLVDKSLSMTFLLEGCLCFFCCWPDVLALQGDVSAIVQVQVSQRYLSHDTVRVLFIVSLLQPCVPVLILLNVDLLCHQLLLRGNNTWHSWLQKRQNVRNVFCLFLEYTWKVHERVNFFP